MQPHDANLIVQFAPDSTAADWVWNDHYPDDGIALRPNPSTHTVRLNYPDILTTAVRAFYNNLAVVAIEDYPDISEVTSFNRFIVQPSVLATNPLRRIVINRGKTTKLTNLDYAFARNPNLQYLDISAIDPAKLSVFSNVFTGDTALATIRCTAAFRDWAIKNASTIALPTAFRSATYSGWEIVSGGGKFLTLNTLPQEGLPYAA